MGVKLFGGAAHWRCPLYPDCLYYILYGPMGSKNDVEILTNSTSGLELQDAEMEQV